MKPVLTEIRDWLGFALGLFGGYAGWRELRRRSAEDVIIRPSAATAVAAIATPTISVEMPDGRRLAWTGEEDVPPALRLNPT